MLIIADCRWLSSLLIEPRSSFAFIQMRAAWEATTGAIAVLDARGLHEDDDDIQEVEMDEVAPSDEQQGDSAADPNADKSWEALAPSKWERIEKTEEKLCEFLSSVAFSCSSFPPFPFFLPSPFPLSSSFPYSPSILAWGPG